MTEERYPAYSKLATIYDALMEDVDYDYWADFIDALIQQHHPDPRTVLELASGTGSMALSLDELGCYQITATDKSPQMITQAREKAKQLQHEVKFRVMDFLDIGLEHTFDVLVCIFDSVNYLHSPSRVLTMLEQIKKVMGPESLFIFDFTTPRNSIQAVNYLNNEEGYANANYRYFRKSRYDPEEKIHYNDFRIEKLSEDRETVVEEFTERHRQRIYTLDEMTGIVEEAGFDIVACYDGFDMEPAHRKSLRITMVLRCPNVPS